MGNTERRRSPRVTAGIRLRVRWAGSEGQPVEEETQTEIVSSVGARVRLKSEVKMGQDVEVTNLENEQTAPGRLVWMGSDASEQGREVAFTFLTASPDFWGTLQYRA